MPSIKKEYEMNAVASEVFNALVDPEVIQVWSEDEAKMGAEVGDKFELWGGQMYGSNLEVIPNKKIVQEWCYDKWAKPSKVTFTIKASGKLSKVVLLHEDVPEISVSSISEGWDSYYLGAIQEMFDEEK